MEASDARPAADVPRGRSSAFRVGAIHVEQLHSSGLQALFDNPYRALHDFVAEFVILLELAANAFAIERDGAREIERAGIEAPAVGREQPGPAENVAIAQRQ